MLFRLICGQDLEEVARFLSANGGECSRADLNQWFVQRSVTGSEATNLEETLIVLRTAGICTGTDPIRYTLHDEQVLELQFLSKLRAFELGLEGGSHALDAWYLRLLQELFIGPDVLYRNDLHRLSNRLSPPIPLSDEKLNSWRRVVEWLGLGRRFGAGFTAVWSMSLVRLLLRDWGQPEGALQDWIRHIERYIPVTPHHGDLPRSLVQPLLCMEALGEVVLSARQDSPGKGYLGERRVKWIQLAGGAVS